MKEKIKTLQIIHLAITLGVAVAYFFVLDKNAIADFKIPTIDSNSIIFALIPLIAIVLSNFMFKSMISKIDRNLSIENKIGVYQTSSIIRWAILEGAAFVLLFLKPEFFVFGIVIIVYLLTIRPTEDKVNTDLN
ncbi:MFS transporter [Flavobacterium terrigena]|uniref:Uncharacterized protein n=1 Tax=Flavobacterium terrigena TaxID=402734 RepID=A0A1H6VV46_9FLAO|nr:MFS transporter [Flavobacterium terrigena]SEJ08503.1 hypothetical protein SAMN05660918_2318 [Flavobacterium terrigena]